MSTESRPVLAGTVRIFEIFMSGWEDLAEEDPTLILLINIGLHWAQKYYRRMDETDVYIVTMGKLFSPSPHEVTADLSHGVLNPCIRFQWITEEWGTKYIKYARTLMYKLVSTSR